MKHQFFFCLVALVMLAGCKSKQRLVNSSIIEQSRIDTIEVPAERSSLSGTLSFIPGTGIVFREIEQKNTPGISTSVAISGDTLRVESQTSRQELPVVTSQTSVKTEYTQEDSNNTWSYIYKTIVAIIVLLACILLFRLLKK